MRSRTGPLERPIIIIGAGRSGTTVFYNLLCLHPDLAWFSNLTDKFPALPALSLAHRMLDLPWIGPRLRRRIYEGAGPKLRPVEAGAIYHDYCGFEHGRKTTRHDVAPAVFTRFRSVAAAHLRWTGRTAFVTKQTANNQRLDAIDALFPDARYVHVVRDGRSVANSLNNVRWWSRTRLWWNQRVVGDLVAEGADSLALAAEHWRSDIEEILAMRERYGDRYIMVRYEDLVADVRGVMRTVLAHCDLPETASHMAALPTSLPDMNRKRSTDLTTVQQERVNAVLRTTLARLGYEAVDPTAP